MLVFTISYFYELNYTYPTTKISDLTIDDLNSKVKFEAMISKQTLYGETLFLELNDKLDYIKGIVFKQPEKLDFKKKYYFVGKVTYQNQELEIIVDEISTIQ